MQKTVIIIFPQYFFSMRQHAHSGLTYVDSKVFTLILHKYFAVIWFRICEFVAKIRSTRIKLIIRYIDIKWIICFYYRISRNYFWIVLFLIIWNMFLLNLFRCGSTWRSPDELISYSARKACYVPHDLQKILLYATRTEQPLVK